MMQTEDEALVPFDPDAPENDIVLRRVKEIVAGLPIDQMPGSTSEICAIFLALGRLEAGGASEGKIGRQRRRPSLLLSGSKRSRPRACRSEPPLRRRAAKRPSGSAAEAASEVSAPGLPGLRRPHPRG